jgi:two-component system response regulator AtoC
VNILLVEDEEMQRSMLRGFLEKQGFNILTAANAAQGLEIFNREAVDLVLLDNRMPDMNGDELLARIKEINPLVRAIMITAFGAVETAVRVMRLGADDFLEKPVDLEKLLGKIKILEEKSLVVNDSQTVNEIIKLNNLPVRIVGDSPAMRNLLSLVLRVAPTPWSVLICGETGTGKELIARLVHLLSPEKDEPFIELNCAAVPENLFESELFGHEKGAFTGAESKRRGKFELAAGGTLFLDEIGELHLPMQAKLLRAIQEKNITRLGGEKSIQIKARIIAATNRSLKDMVKQGKFREDLYFRLKVIELEIPPLRQRKEDIPALISFFLKEFKSQVKFDRQAMVMLTKYNFPGNVRELEHIIQQVITLSRTTLISVKDLPQEVREYQGEERAGVLNERLNALERQMIISALEQHNWVQTKAAASLGISERVLRYKIEKNGIKKS